MLDPMSGVADQTVDFLSEEKGKSKDGLVDFKKVFQGLAINTIAKCAFGVDADAHRKYLSY